MPEREQRNYGEWVHKIITALAIALLLTIGSGLMQVRDTVRDVPQLKDDIAALRLALRGYENDKSKMVTEIAVIKTQLQNIDGKVTLIYNAVVRQP